MKFIKKAKKVFFSTSTAALLTIFTVFADLNPRSQ